MPNATKWRDRTAYFAEYYRANRERIRQRQREYYQVNREKNNAMSARWRRQNRDVVNFARRNGMSVQEARAMRRLAIVKLSLRYQMKGKNANGQQPGERG